MRGLYTDSEMASRKKGKSSDLADQADSIPHNLFNPLTVFGVPERSTVEGCVHVASW